MKKFLVTALVLVLGAGVALGQLSLNIPFFNDSGDNLSGTTPTTGSAAFIGIKNTTGATIVVQVDFTSVVDGDPLPEDNVANTFELGPNASISFRPVATDGAEGVGSLVTNMASGKTAGSASIIWATETNPDPDATEEDILAENYLGNAAPSDIQGRYVEIASDGNVYGYLLPPGS